MVKQEEINGYFLEVIRFLKSEYGYTQEFIVEKAKLGKSAISKIKNGEVNVGDKTINKLCDAFDMLNPNFFYGNSPYKTKREKAEAKMESALKDKQDAYNENHSTGREESLKDELIASLKSQITVLENQIVDKNRIIQLQDQKIEMLEAMQHIDADNPLKNYPFTPGVADKEEQYTTRV